jgi:hypothetical protein
MASAPKDDQDRYRVPFQTLLADARRRCDHIETLLQALENRYREKSEDRSYREFSHAVLLANHGARTRLDRDEEKFEQAPAAAFDSAKSLVESFPDSHERPASALLSRRAEALEVFALPFTRLTKSLLANAEVLFFGWPLDRYELRTYDLDFVRAFDSNAAANIEREYRGDIQFMQFLHPVTRQPDLFQHAVFGHELGHAAIRRTPPSDVLEALGVEIETPTYVNVAVAKAGANRFSPLEQKTLSAWFDELACDVFGMRTLGPAYAAAFVEVTSVNRDLERREVVGSTDNYPPERLRLKVLMNELERYDFGVRADDLSSVLKSLASSALGTTEADDEIKGSIEWLDEALDAFRDVSLPSLLGDHILNPSDFRDDLVAVWGLAEAEVPPAEKLLIGEIEPVQNGELAAWSREYDWRAVLNGVFMWHLAHASSAKFNPREIAAHRAEAIRLATGAIEMAEFHRRARKLRDQYEPMRLPTEFQP